MLLTRRDLMKHGAAGAALLTASGVPFRAFAEGDELTIAYNVNLPSFDPTVGPSAVNPTIQGIYQSVFDQYIAQAPDLNLAPGLLTEWGWNDDRTKIMMTVREGATWHDGSPVTPEDVVWSLRARRRREDRQPDPVRLGQDRQLLDRRQHDHGRRRSRSSRRSSNGWASSPATCCRRPITRRSAPEGFEKAPIGSGPYKVVKFEQNAFLQARRARRPTGAGRRPTRMSSSSSCPTRRAASPRSIPARARWCSTFPMRSSTG